MIRMSTQSLFDINLASMARQQVEFLEVGQQLATGRRVVSPSDDPLAASQALTIRQSQAVNEQYTDARVRAKNALSQSETVLSSVIDGIASARVTLVQAANGTLNDADRSALAESLRGVRETLLGQANTSDGNGGYIFGGFESGSVPFVDQGGVSYQGDQGVLALQVDASRQLQINDTGDRIFMSVQPGARFIATQNLANTGNVRYTGPEIVDPSDPNFGEDLTVRFFDAGGGVMHYEVLDSAPAVLATGPYVEGDGINFAGLNMTFDGTPVDNDQFSVGPARTQGASIFDALDDVIAALETPTGDDADLAALDNAVTTAQRKLANAQDNVLTIRASVGTRINELNVLDKIGSNKDLNYTQSISELIDLDYNEAISRYTLQQVALQAAQKAFVDVQGNNLFDLL